jgi:hypothetical protein
MYYNNCTSCTGNLYFIPALSVCISNCEQYNLTKSLSTPNLCVKFDATAALLNVNTTIPINPNNFTLLVGKVLQSTSANYSTNWRLDFDATVAANNNSAALVLDPNGPFVSDTTNLTVSLNPSFFQLNMNYVFDLDIISENRGNNVTVTKNWTLIMNKIPRGGLVTTIPKAGFRNTTVFLISCPGWIDDNTVNLQYSFYTVENNTSVQNILANFSYSSETYSKFNVRYYQQNSSSINVTCQIMDSMGAVASATTTVNILLILDNNC